MQTFTIKEIETKQSKDGSKTFYIIHTQDGAQMSSFDESVKVLTPGTTIDAEVEVKGKYTNLKSYQAKSAPPTPSARPASVPPLSGVTQPFNRTDPQTQLRIAELNKQSIQAQVALKELGECVRVEKIPPQFRVVYWRTIGTWLGCDMTWDDLMSASMPNPPSQPGNVPPAMPSVAKLATVEQLDAFYAYTGRQPEKLEQFNAWLSHKFGRPLKQDFSDVTEAEAEEVLNVIRTAGRAGQVKK